MTIKDQIRDKKLQYDINRKAAKLSVLSSGKISKYEYLTGKEQIIQEQIIEKSKFYNSSLAKAFEKQIKTIEDKGEKQVDASKTLKSKELEAIKDNNSNDNEKLSKYKEIFEEF